MSKIHSHSFIKLSLVFLLPVLTFHPAFSQDFYAEFQQYSQPNDTVKQLEILTNWESVKPNDPELFTSYFNYYFTKSIQEALTVTKEQPKGKSLEFTDSANQVAGYIGSQVCYVENELQKGFAKIDEGIRLYPDRLDMRFGKIYVLGELENWKEFTGEIIKTIDYSAKNNNQWTWTLNEKKENGEDFFLSSLQDYQVQLYNTEDDNLLKYMRDIANEVLKFYPNHVESLSNVALTYLIAGEYDKALPPLLHAEKIAPEDYIVLSNIAVAYRKKGNKEQAVEYYKKVQKFGDEDAKSYAKQQIQELSK